MEPTPVGLDPAQRCDVAVGSSVESESEKPAAGGAAMPKAEIQTLSISALVAEIRWMQKELLQFTRLIVHLKISKPLLDNLNHTGVNLFSILAW